jgi:hypothetical protein
MDGPRLTRIRRIYAAIEETIEADMSQLPAHVICTDKVKLFFQDFSGNATPEQLENRLHALIEIVASLEYHLRR